jgi:hypothetical protein
MLFQRNRPSPQTEWGEYEHCLNTCIIAQNKCFPGWIRAPDNVDSKNKNIDEYCPEISARPATYIMAGMRDPPKLCIHRRPRLCRTSHCVFWTLQSHNSRESWTLCGANLNSNYHFSAGDSGFRRILLSIVKALPWCGGTRFGYVCSLDCVLTPVKIFLFSSPEWRDCVRRRVNSLRSTITKRLCWFWRRLVKDW